MFGLVNESLLGCANINCLRDACLVVRSNTESMLSVSATQHTSAKTCGYSRDANIIRVYLDGLGILANSQSSEVTPKSTSSLDRGLFSPPISVCSIVAVYLPTGIRLVKVS